MDADDVELEFVSVMGVLVPIEVAKGASNEAKTIAGVDVDEEERDEDQISPQITKLPKQEDTNPVEAKIAPATACTNVAIAKANCSKHADSLEEKCRDFEENGDTVEKITAESVNERVKRVKTLTTIKSRVKVGATAKLEKTNNKSKVKKQKEKNDTEELSQKVVQMPMETQQTVTRKKIHNQVTAAADTRPRPAKRKSAAVSSLSAVHSRAVPKRTKVANRPHHIAFHTKDTPKSAKISGTWILESDDEKQGSQRNNRSGIRPSKSKQVAMDGGAGTTMKDSKRNFTASSPRCCAFPGCTSPARYNCRCDEHRVRRHCSMEGCNKVSQRGGKCIAHGGGARCAEDGCDRLVRSMGKCYAHGGGKLCSHPNCTARAKTKGKCSRHGQEAECTERGCVKLVTVNGKCIAHGG